MDFIAIIITLMGILGIELFIAFVLIPRFVYWYIRNHLQDILYILFESPEFEEIRKAIRERLQKWIYGQLGGRPPSFKFSDIISMILPSVIEKFTKIPPPPSQ
jgi:hypothetical protein